MASSAFNIITSADMGAPQLNGISGSLINILDYCLVTGSGWLQPSASVVGADGRLQQSIYQQPSGSKCILYVNDAAPFSTPAGKEAWITGWENITNLTAPVGTGSNQFPMFGQLLGNGHYAVRKSTSIDFLPRYWKMYVDPYTFYLFVKTGDTADVYVSLFFGDMFSLRGTNDKIKCIISARTDNNNNAGAQDQNDTITMPLALVAGFANGINMITSRNMGGRYTCPQLGKVGAYGLVSTTTPTNAYNQMVGVIPIPNPSDGSIYMHPIYVWEAGMGFRGRMRGMYHIPSTLASCPDGLTFNGTNEFSGKTFQIVSKGANGGFWCIEISNTLETN